MINAINTEYGMVRLVPDQLVQRPALKLFAADSMSLIIGANGSGKSRTLSSMVSGILNVNTSVEGLDNPYSKTFVIYYTPVPYTVDLPDENHQFVNLQSRARARGNRATDVSMLKSIVKNFDIVPEISVDFQFSQQIITEVLMLISLAGVLATAQLPAPLQGALAERDLARSAAEKFRRDGKVDYLRYIDTPQHEAISVAQAALEARIREYLYEKLAPCPSLKLLALQRTVREHNKKTDIIQAVLQDAGVPFVRRLKTVPQTALRTYRKNIEDLEHARRLLDLPDLPETRQVLVDMSTDSLNDLKQYAIIDVAKLSAGGNALINQFSKIEGILRQRRSRMREFDNLLLLIDEGDIFLHLSWQQKYVAYLDNYIKSVKERHIFRTVQVVLTTHSPVLMSDFPRDSIVKLKVNGKSPGRADPGADGAGASEDDAIVSFGAPLQEIINRSGDAGTMGEFAANFIGGMVQQIKRGDNPDPYHIDLIDDQVIKSYIKSRCDREARADA
jgi:predicted ATPase